MIGNFFSALAIDINIEPFVFFEKPYITIQRENTSKTMATYLGHSLQKIVVNS